MKRLLVAAGALLLGGGVSAFLLVVADPSRNSVEVYAATRDLPAGAVIDAGAIQLERVGAAGARAFLFTIDDEAQLAGKRAGHDLMAGQLIQRSDLLDSRSAADRRLVFVPIKDVPSTEPGGRVDLLMLNGSADHPSVAPFALGVEVHAQVSNGLVLVVASTQASAFVYAATSMRLVAVVAEPGTAGGAEVPVDSADQAVVEAARK